MRYLNKLYNSYSAIESTQLHQSIE